MYNLPCVVAARTQFPTDTKAEVELVERKCKELGVNVALSQVWAKGGEGGLALADEVVRLCAGGDEQGRSAEETFQFAYDDELSLKEKIEAIAKRVYRADGVHFEPAAAKEIAETRKPRLRRHARVHGKVPSTRSPTIRPSSARRAISPSRCARSR